MKPKLPASRMLSMRLKTIVSVAVLIFVCTVTSSTGQAQVPEMVGRTDWLTGRQLDLHLQKPISASWTDSPIKSRLLNFAHQQKVGIFVDRRIDTEQLVSITSGDVSIEQFLWQVAAQGGWGICRLDDFFYLGPPETTATLPILWQQMKAETRKRSQDYEVAWSKRSEFELDEIFIPAEVIQELSRQHEFAVTSGKLPHDVWLPVDLPANSLDGQVGILVVGFNQWFTRSRNGKDVELIEFPEIERGQIEIGPIENAREMLKELRKNYPTCRLGISGKTLRATGTPAELVKVRAEIVRTNGQPDVKDGEQRFTLTTKAARGRILATIAQQTGNKLEFAPDLAAVLQEHIEIKVTDVTLEELLQTVLEGTDAKYTLGNGKLKINN